MHRIVPLCNVHMPRLDDDNLGAEPRVMGRAGQCSVAATFCVWKLEACSVSCSTSISFRFERLSNIFHENMYSYVII